MPPFRARPAIEAGLADIQRATSPSACPLLEASVQTAARPSWSEATAPQAAAKSGTFSSAGEGEWSDTTQLSTPPASPSQSRSRLAADRIGGQHLYAVSPSGTCSAVSVR